MEARNLAEFYSIFGERTTFLHLPPGQKKPADESWQNLTYEQSRSPEYQRLLLNGNLGVLLGPPSDNLVSTDFDSDDKYLLYEKANHDLCSTTQTRGRRGRNLWYRIKGCYPRCICRFDPKKSFGEWRGGKGQTVVDGTHPDTGQPYQFLRKIPPLSIEFSDIAWPGIFKVPAEAEEFEEPLRSLSDPCSIFQLADEPIDFSLNLLGNRWLSRASGAIVCAPSGIGKSTLSFQAAILWSCGKLAFGIKPIGPLRILIVQSEDDRNDMIEMAQVIHQMLKAGILTTTDLCLVDANTHIERVSDLSGEPFTRHLAHWLSSRPFDLVIINPLMSFAGCELSDQVALTSFLRAKLWPVLSTHKAGSLVIHHTGKLLGESEKQREWWEYMYLLFGSSEITNWARAIVFIKPTTEPLTFEFISAKRHDKIGWTDRSYFFSHSKSGLLWVPSTAEDVQTSKTKPCKPVLKYDALLKLIKPTEKISRAEFLQRSKHSLDKGRDWTDTALKEMVLKNKLLRSEFPNPNGQPSVFYFLPTPFEEFSDSWKTNQ